MTRVLGNHPVSRQYFKGVYARDMLPQFPQTFKKSFYVINIDPKHMPGSHWVVVYFDNGKGFYFDSFGVPPIHRDIIQFLEKASSYRYNDRIIQHVNGITCGLYCVFVILHLSKGYSIQYVLNSFESNRSYVNDRKIRQWAASNISF